MSAAIAPVAVVPVLESLDFGELRFAYVRTPEGPFFVLRSICESFGLDVRSQQRRAEGLGWATCKVVTASQVGAPQGRAYFTLAADSLPLWLGTISASRVALPLRPRLLDFQRRCAQILRDHFFGPRAAIEPAAITRTRALEIALEASRERDALEARVAALEPRARVADILTSAEGLHSIAEAANVIGPEVGQNRLFAFLRRERFLISSIRPYQRHVEAGRVVVREVFFSRNGKRRASARVYLTPKGLAYVAALWRARGDQPRAEAS